MKIFLLIIGIVTLVACVGSILFAALNLYGYHHVLDGSSELYHRMRQRAVVFFVIGLVLAAVGALCLILRARL